MVPEMGLEPITPYGVQILSLLRMPIPPLRRVGQLSTSYFEGHKSQVLTTASHKRKPLLPFN